MARLFLAINQTLHDSIVEAQRTAEEEAAKKSRWSIFGDGKDETALPIESPFSAAAASLAEGVVGANNSKMVPPSFDTVNVGANPKLDRYVNDKVVIDQDRDMYKCVFALSLVDTCSPSYLVAIVAEYIRTLNHFRLTISNNITCFLVSLLADSGHFFRLHQFIQYKVVHDSEAVAEKLLEMRHQHHAAFQLAVDMLQRLKSADRIVQVLLIEGKVQHSQLCFYYLLPHILLLRLLFCTNSSRLVSSSSIIAAFLAERSYEYIVLVRLYCSVKLCHDMVCRYWMRCCTRGVIT